MQLAMSPQLAVMWPQYFPGGVADSTGQYALVSDRQDCLVAVALEHGTRLWRSEVALRPLLLCPEHAIGLAVSPPQVVSIAVLGKQAGRVEWTSPTLSWPQWAIDTSSSGLTMDIEAAFLDKDVGLHWCLRPCHAGGAAKGLGRPTLTFAEGQCRVDIGSGAVRAMVAWPERPAGFAQGVESSDPTVIAQAQLGAKLYKLMVSDTAAGLRTTLGAYDKAEGNQLWEHSLGEAPRQPPFALRP